MRGNTFLVMTHDAPARPFPYFWATSYSSFFHQLLPCVSAEIVLGVGHAFKVSVSESFAIDVAEIIKSCKPLLINLFYKAAELEDSRELLLMNPRHVWSSNWFRISSVFRLLGPRASQQGLRASPRGADGRTYGRTYGRNFSPFYRTSSPVGAAALLPPETSRHQRSRARVPLTSWCLLAFY